MKRTNFAKIDAAFARSTQRQFAELNQALRHLRDNQSGLRRGLRVPIPRGGSRYIKGSRTAPSALERAAINSAGRFISSGFLSSVGLGSGSFYDSTMQIFSSNNSLLQLAQRIM
ncbi:MAG TPA: hypothetical protein VFR09_09300 [Alphaproteobacteria bacterium]|nr:hypothetical protein [Alphaproteobacteria bacterium]